MSLGIYTYNFLFEYKKRAKEFECFNCKLVSPKNYFIKCKHCICQECLKGMEFDKCPFDNIEIITGGKEPTAYQFIILDKLLNPFIMKCIFKGCQWVDKYQNFIEKHYNECQFKRDENLLDEYFNGCEAIKINRNRNRNKSKKKPQKNIKNNKNINEFELDKNEEIYSDNEISTRNIILNDEEDEEKDKDKEYEEDINQNDILENEKYIFLDNNIQDIQDIQDNEEDEYVESKENENENENYIIINNDKDEEEEENENRNSHDKDEEDEEDKENKNKYFYYSKQNLTDGAKYNYLIIDEKNKINLSFDNSSKINNINGIGNNKNNELSELYDYEYDEYNYNYSIGKKRKRSNEIFI